MATFAARLDKDPAKIKAWLDAQAGSTVNWAVMVENGPKSVIIVIDKS